MISWYRNAVIYSLDVRTFQDSDGDGVGDFDGLVRRLDYLSGLGVTALWLKPFFPSPMRDGGYDVTDYYDVDERVGGMAAFVRFARAAGAAGLRFVVDLPLNHTSCDHPWFREARRSRSSRYRDYYIWADEPPPNSPEQIVYRHGEPNPWTFDEDAGQYYLHRFYADEPDLDHANPAVREEVLRIVEFWLQLGASGLRIDAAPYLAKKSAADAHEHDPHAFLRELHQRAIDIRPDAMLMAEADVKPAELQSYFGDGAEMHMLFDFLLNNYFFLALAREEAEPLVKVLGVLPRRPARAQWANWVRNHDELDLERLAERERADVMAAFAPEADMRIYQRGIRRRFAPMVDGDQRRMELAFALLFALPGTPIIRYGEEIGMGDDLALHERDAVRTTMQWSPEPNGGFSTCPPDVACMPAIEGGPFGFLELNVATQQLARDSFLARMRLLVAVRRQHPELGTEEPEILDTGDPAVFALAYRVQARATVVVHNLCGGERTATLKQLEGHRYLYDVLGDQGYEPFADGMWEATMNPYGYRWFLTDTTGITEPGASARAATGALGDKPR